MKFSKDRKRCPIPRKVEGHQGEVPIDAIVSVNIALEIVSIVITVVIMICQLADPNRHLKQNRLFIWMLLVNAGVLLSDLVTWTFRGQTGAFVDAMIRIANACVYSLGYIIVALFTHYLIAFFQNRGQRMPRILPHLITGLCVVAVLLVILSQFNHMYYRFDEQNIYHRGDWYWLSQTWAIVLMIVNMVLVLRYRKALTRRELLSLLSYGLFPVVAMTIQIFVYGLTLLYMSTTLSMFIIYAGTQVEQSERMRRQEQELAESRIAILLSQIQSHFLHNSLVVIRQLCDVDQEQAKEAITDFSDYLRVNLDAMTRNKPVPFEEELRHVKAYIALEKRRFGTKLRVVYDIGETDFDIPALTLQPIVENAIRHGINRRPEGGTVTIQSKAVQDGWQVSVLDDGMGFQEKALPQNDRSHIGIENVQKRLHTMTQGELDIRSTPGEGTAVTIFLPRSVA